MENSGNLCDENELKNKKGTKKNYVHAQKTNTQKVYFCENIFMNL
jgi:hypothetical protein